MKVNFIELNKDLWVINTYSFKVWRHLLGAKFKLSALKFSSSVIVNAISFPW